MITVVPCYVGRPPPTRTDIDGRLAYSLSPFRLDTPKLTWRAEAGHWIAAQLAFRDTARRLSPATSRDTIEVPNSLRF